MQITPISRYQKIRSKNENKVCRQGIILLYDASTFIMGNYFEREMERNILDCFLDFVVVFVVTLIVTIVVIAQFL